MFKKNIYTYILYILYLIKYTYINIFVHIQIYKCTHIKDRSLPDMALCGSFTYGI